MIKKLIYICAVMVGSLSGLSSCSLDIPPSDQYSDPDCGYFNGTLSFVFCL